MVLVEGTVKKIALSLLRVELVSTCKIQVRPTQCMKNKASFGLISLLE